MLVWQQRIRLLNISRKVRLYSEDIVKTATPDNSFNPTGMSLLLIVKLSHDAVVLRRVSRVSGHAGRV